MARPRSRTNPLEESILDNLSEIRQAALLGYLLPRRAFHPRRNDAPKRPADGPEHHPVMATDCEATVRLISCGQLYRAAVMEVAGSMLRTVSALSVAHPWIRIVVKSKRTKVIHFIRLMAIQSLLNDMVSADREAGKANPCTTLTTDPV